MSHTSKQQQRQQSYLARNAQINKSVLSEKICQSVLRLPQYQQAKTVMWYLHCRSEVQTLNTVKAQLISDKKIVIPYCTHDEQGHRALGLWHLESLDELVCGTWGILEPPKDKWLEPCKKIEPQELDFIVVPGVAFNETGARLGNGAGYYDKLLSKVLNKTVLSGICFESQLIEELVTEEHDVFMDFIITEKRVLNTSKTTTY